MKKFIFLWGIFFFFSSFVLAAEIEVEGKVKVNYLEGKALVQDKELQIGQFLTPPVEIKVKEKSKLELVLPDGSVLRFNENTTLTLVKALYDEKNSKREMKTQLMLGECWASVKKLMAKDNKFELETPTAVAGVAGTKYRAVVAAEYNRFLVYDGKIQVGYRPVSEEYKPGKSLMAQRVSGPKKVEGPKRVSLQEWLVIVGAGYEFVLYPDGRFAPPKKFALEEDEQNPWVRWNKERDKLLGF